MGQRGFVQSVAVVVFLLQSLPALGLGLEMRHHATVWGDSNGLEFGVKRGAAPALPDDSIAVHN